MTPGRNCSTTTSACSSKGRSVAAASGDLRSSARLRLPRLSSANGSPMRSPSTSSSGSYARMSSPPAGRSILMTSAPASAMSRVASGPGSKVLKSRMRTPFRAAIVGFLSSVRGSR